MYLLTIGACCTYSKVTALSAILRRYWTREAVPSDQYERWWEINQNGALVDACFLADPATFNFKRTEVTATSSALLRPEAKKLVDGLLLFAEWVAWLVRGRSSCAWKLRERTTRITQGPTSSS